MIDFPKKHNQPTVYFNEPNFLNYQEVNNLLSLINNIPYSKGEVFSEDSSYLRKSNVKWLPFSEEFKNIYLKTIEKIHYFNSSAWRFKIKHAEEQFQYTEYEGNYKGKYDWHVDLGKGNTCTRKISVTIQLSDPTEYEGGELQLFDPITDKIDFPYVSIEKAKGTITVFPSFTPHRVTPVTKGIRKSLVLWVGGVPFR
jgi:PKHD-type hydroxylase